MTAGTSFNDATQKAAETGQNAAGAVAGAATAIGQRAAAAGEQAARSTEDVARFGLEAARDTLQTSLDTALKGAQRITEQFNQMLGFADPNSQELTRRSAQSLQAVSQAGTVLAKGVQQISQEWLSLSQERFTQNVEGLSKLARCQSVQDLIAVQSELVRDNLQSALGMGQRVAELSTRLATEAAGAIQAQGSRTGVEVNRNATRARQVA